MMNRRGFLRVATGGAVGVTLLQAEACHSPLRQQKVANDVTPRVEIPTTCDMCVNKCSMIAVVEKGIVKKLNPNPENPKSKGLLCAPVHAGIQQLYAPAPINHPMIRNGERGEGKWKVVSWDE